MKGQLEFREKLAGIVAICKEKGGEIHVEEVQNYFEEDQLSEEQMELVCDYLLAQKMIVKGYVKNGGRLHTTEEKADAAFTPEEREFLKRYTKELGEMSQEDPFAYYLPKILEIAKEMHREGVFLGDLVQEGSIGLMLALDQPNTGETEILRMAKEMMQMLLETQDEVRVQDQRMADRVNDLDEEIKRLTEEMGRKVTVDELAEFTSRTEEEILDLLKMAGETVEEGEENKNGTP